MARLDGRLSLARACPFAVHERYPLMSPREADPAELRSVLPGRATAAMATTAPAADKGEGTETKRDLP